MNEFRKLKTLPLATIETIGRPAHNTQVDLHSPAVEVLTDFSEQEPLMIEGSTTIDEAQALMNKTHVKLKLVIDSRESFRGVLSFADLLSIKVMQAMERSGLSRGEITVADIMTPRDSLHAIDIADIKSARIGDLLATMQTFGDQHVLIIDARENCIRGMVSANDIARSLNIPVTIAERANSFAEIYDAVKH